MKVPLTINDFLDRARTVFPDRVGVVDESDQPATTLGTLTYAEFYDHARAMAAGLDDLGVPVGGRVAIVSHNSARLLIGLWGCGGWGRVAVPVNFRLNAEEVAYIVEQSGADVLLVDPELDESLSSVVTKHRFVLGDDSAIFKFGVEPTKWEPDEDALCSINYTSGTTARPKGVVQTHRTRWLNATTFGWHIGVCESDVYLHTLPMFHCDGWGVLYSVTGMGVPHIVLRKVDGAEILRRVDEHGVTLMCGAPAVCAAVLDAAAAWEGPIPGAGRTRIVVAGAPPPTKVIERIETELGWEFIQIYGLTETAPLLTINRHRPEWDGLSTTERAKKLSRAGTPAVGVTMRVADDGEFLARGNHILHEYWQNPEATDAALDGGWFHTGDGGHCEDDAHYVIADRKKDVIISGGENISSIEVEDALFSHPDVVEVGVIGVPDVKWGETPKALVVVAEGASPSEAELIEWCRERLAHYKCPTSVEFRDVLARTATGKLQKYRLRQPYWADQASQVN